MTVDEAKAWDEAIDRFWDQAIQSRAGADWNLDPADAATIRLLHAADDRPGPTRAFRRHLREDLMQAHAIPVASGPSALPSANGHVRQPWQVVPETLPPSRKGRALAHLATAALLLLTVVGSIFVFGPGRSGQPDDAPALLPAVSGTPAAGTPMLELTLDDLRPFRAVGGLGVTNYPPGGGSQLRTGRESSDVFHVAAGPLTLRVVQASVPVRVDLAGTGVQGTFDATLGADEELILATGATVVMPPSAEIVLSNTGSRPARMLELLFSADSPLRPTGDATFEGPWGSKGHDVAAPVTIRLEQRVLAPGDQLPAATTPNTYQSAAVFEATRRMDLRFDPDGTIRNGGASPLGVYVLLVRTGSDGETVTSAPPAGT